MILSSWMRIAIMALGLLILVMHLLLAVWRFRSTSDRDGRLDALSHLAPASGALLFALSPLAPSPRLTLGAMVIALLSFTPLGTIVYELLVSSARKR